MTAPPAALVGVLACLVGGLGVAHMTQPISSAARPTAAGFGAPEPVLRSARVCLDSGPASAGVTTRLSVGTVPMPAGMQRSAAGSTVSVAPLAAAAAPTPVLDRAGVVAAVPVAVATDGTVVVRAAGPTAGALEAVQLSHGTAGAERGYASVRCEAPGTDAWYVGGSTTVGVSSTLVLVNIDDVPAQADITFWSSSGPVDSRAGQGLVVPPRSRRTLPMETLAPDQDNVAVHVHTRTGRLASGLRQQRGTPDTPLGVDWVPATGPPARGAVVAGIPAGPGTRTLLVANPGPDDVVVAVQLSTADGQFVPSGLDAAPVPAGTVQLVDLSAQLATTPAAVRVTTDGAGVLAAVFADTPDRDGVGTDFAWLAAAGALDGPALLADTALDPKSQVTLLLTAPDAGATVTVTPVDVPGAPADTAPEQSVTIPAGRTVSLVLSSAAGGGMRALAVSVSPGSGSGPVYAARVLTETGTPGHLLTWLALRTPAVTVRLPTVREDPGAALLGAD